MAYRLNYSTYHIRKRVFRDHFELIQFWNCYVYFHISIYRMKTEVYWNVVCKTNPKEIYETMHMIIHKGHKYIGNETFSMNAV